VEAVPPVEAVAEAGEEAGKAGPGRHPLVSCPKMTFIDGLSVLPSPHFIPVTVVTAPAWPYR
jgi:hypothetical protein